jgi:hypothetical protein
MKTAYPAQRETSAASAAIFSVLLALGAVVVLPVALSYLGLQNLTGLLFRLAR